MTLFEVILSIIGALGTILLTAMGFLLNRQFTKLDKIDNDFLETKSKMLEVINTGQNQNREILQHFEQRKPENYFDDIKAQIVMIKEFQRNKVEPTLTKVLSMADRVDAQSKKQNESDVILSKLFEVVKKLVENKNKI